MRNTSSSAVVTALALSLLLLPALPAQGERAPGVEDLDEALEKVVRYADDGRFDRARRELDDVLEEHEGAAYGHLRRARLEELLTRIAFGEKHPAPEVDEILAGDVQRWNARRNLIKVAYDGSSRREDWEERAKVFPAAFKGPHKIRVEGSSYPGHGNGLIVTCCAGEKGALAALFGRAQVNEGRSASWVPARLAWIDEDGNPRTLDEKESTPCRPGKRFVVEVVVTRRGVKMTYNRRLVLNSRRPEDEYGYLLWPEGATVDRLVIEGEIEPAFIQERMERHQAALREDFLDDFTPREHLPEWVYEAPTPADELARLPEHAEYPGGPLDRRTDRATDRAILAARTEGWRAAKKHLDRLDDGELNPANRAWFEAYIALQCGRPDVALEASERLRSLAEGSDDADFFQVRSLLELRRVDTAREPTEAFLERFPGEAQLWIQYCLATLSSGDASGARAILDRALALGLSSEDLKVIDRMLRRALHGPEWTARFEHRSRNYHIISDIDERTCKEAADILEETYLSFTARLEAVRSGGRFKVYLFSSGAGFREFCEDLFGARMEHAAGLYSPTLKVLLIWNLPSREEMLQTVRHEGWHQYADRVLVSQAIWFDEGLAEIFETAELVGGVWRIGRPREDHLAVLKRGMTPLERFFFLTPSEFMRNAESNYAQAWAFVKFLREGPSEWRPLFDTFWEAFQEHPSSAAAVEAVLETVDLRDLERDFQTWVNEIRED